MITDKKLHDMLVERTQWLLDTHEELVEKIEKYRDALQDISAHNINSEESAFRIQEIARKALK